MPHDNVVRIASLPGINNANPYIRLFYNSLCHNDYLVYVNITYDINSYEAIENMSDFDVIHIHWPEKIWKSHRLGIIRGLEGLGVKGTWRLRYAFPHVRQVFGLRKLGRFLREARDHKIRVIWTLHNIEPHEKTPILDRAGYSMMASAADLIICHSELTRLQCLEQLNPECPVVVMPIGNYDGVYPASEERTIVMRNLGLDPDLPLVSSLGEMRYYKGIDIACRAVAALGGRVQFVAAGLCSEPRILRNLDSQVRGKTWIKLIPRILTDQEFADISCASNAILLPYRKITGSSALLAALTFHRGVVASDLPYFREILQDEPDAGRLARAGDPSALSDAIEAYLYGVPPARRASAARRISERYRWDDLVKPVAEVIAGWSRPLGADGETAPNGAVPGIEATQSHRI